MSQRSYADILRTGARNRGNRGYELAGSYEEEFPLPPRPQRIARTCQPRHSRNAMEQDVHPTRHREQTNTNPSCHVFEWPTHTNSTCVTQAPDPSRSVRTSTNVFTNVTQRISHQVTSTPLQYPKEQGHRVTIQEGTTLKHQLQVTVLKTIHSSTRVSIVKHSSQQVSDQPNSARVGSLSKRACYVEHRDLVPETKKQKVKSDVVSTSADKKRSKEIRVPPSQIKQGSASAAPLNPFNQGLLFEVSSQCCTTQPF